MMQLKPNIVFCVRWWVVRMSNQRYAKTQQVDSPRGKRRPGRQFHSNIILIPQVVVPKVSIVGPKEIFVDVGSKAVVECAMENIITVPEFVLWSFNGKVVSTKYN